MADLSCNFLGIRSPNPFWLASAPPTDKAYNVNRAFEAGWGGVVWKTLGEDPPIVNVSGPRYGFLHNTARQLIGFNNIELITDRPLDVNLQEIRQVKRDWPDRALVVSLMVPCEERAWKKILPMVEDTGADGVELNFGCPHGMSERGMGAAVGQVPEYVEMVTRWCKEHSRLPVIVKLTPNVTNILGPARAAKQGNADAVSLINTISAIMHVDLDRMTPSPHVDGRAAHGGYCGPAVKPIALRMVGEIARDPECKGLPISAIGGINTWRDAAEFMALGAANVQVCTAAMVYGFKIVEDMIDGLNNWMDEKGYRTLSEFTGKAVPQLRGLGAPEPAVRGEGPHRPGPVHPVRPLPHRLRGHLAPGHHEGEERPPLLRSERQGMRGLQPVRGGVPGGELHHVASAARRQHRSAHRPQGRRVRRLDDASE